MANSRGNPLIRSPRLAGGARIGGCQPSQPSDGPVVAVRVPVTGRADRDRTTRAGYLAKSLHQMLPASWRHSQTADTICRRGPGQQPEVITGELTFAIGRQGGGNDLDVD